jgi:effector-binding domain-containing protein
VTREPRIEDRAEQPYVEIAAPIAAPVSGSGRIHAGALPAGRYATFLHAGPYSHAEVPDLESARSLLLDWADQNGVKIARSETDGGTAFGACVEHYLTDASREPDWSKWETELAYLVDEA